MANNWRPTVSQEAKTKAKSQIRFTVNDLIYNKHKDLVKKEVGEMLGIDPNTVDFGRTTGFQNRTAAIKRILDRMTIGEKEGLAAEVENLKKNGLPQDIQRRLVFLLSVYYFKD